MSSSRFSRKVALRYLWSKRAEAFISIITIISILGVAVSVVVLNIVMAVMTGFEHELKEKILNANSHVVVRTLSGEMRNWSAVSEELKKIKNVTSVSPYTYHQVLIRTGTRSSGVLLRGIKKESAAAKQVSSYLKDSNLIDQLFDPPNLEVNLSNDNSDSVKLPGLIIGEELAKSVNTYSWSTAYYYLTSGYLFTFWASS